MEFKDAQMLLNNILSCAEKDPKDLTLYYVMRKYDKDIPFPDLKTGKNLPTRKKVLKHLKRMLKLMVHHMVHQQNTKIQIQQLLQIQITHQQIGQL